MATAIETNASDVLNDIALVESTVAAPDKVRAKGMTKEEKAAAAKLRGEVLAAAKRVIFGVFHKENGAGDFLGSALKGILKDQNNGKSVKARSVSEQQIASVPVTLLLTRLETVRTNRLNGIDDTVKARSVLHNDKQERVYSDTELAAWAKVEKDLAQKRFEKAQEWANTNWARVPSAMKAIRIAGDGTVETQDGERKPTALAFEMVLLNRAETARQFCRAMGDGFVK